MKSQIKNFQKFLPLLSELTNRDIKLKYRRSVLGIVWSVLNPLLMMLVITAVFSTIFKSNIPNFPAYYLTGSAIFNFFSEATNGAMNSILISSSLIKKVYIPKYIFPVEKIIFAFVNFLFSMIAVFIVMLMTGSPMNFTIFLSPILLVYVFIFSTGIGLILSVAAVFFRDVIHLYSVVITALSFATPMIYPVEILPPSILMLIEFNPLFHYVEYFRACMLYGTIPSFMDNLICLAFAILSLGLGILIFKKNQDKFILYV